MEIRTIPEVPLKFERYPPEIRKKMVTLRQLILDTARNTGLPRIVETLKWNEPAYMVKWGSTIRIDWKKSSPGVYAMYFICTTSLVSTFKMVYGDRFRYDGNRALLFPVDEPLPENEVRHCIELALHYHSLKDLPLLGI